MHFVIDETHAGDRIDAFVSSKVPNVSRSSMKKLSTSEQVVVNGKLAKSSYRLKDGDIVDITDGLGEMPEYSEINIPNLYEDDNCVVINKPAGVLSHSKGKFNPEPTVETWLLKYIQDIKGERAGIVHRLDRHTSGVMICAKNIATFKWLQKQFANRKVEKTYIAIVKGHLEHNKATIDMPIGRNPKKPSTFRADPSGKAAVTDYKVLKSSSKLDMLELKPKTGRTHQLRVHLKQVGHPIIGDFIYGKDIDSRMYLHAFKLGLTLKDGSRHTFTADLPDSFDQLMESDRG
ncbi:MAG TPA: RluA family pseudouridine synthase [Candidatus Saccharimonadales bacterium]|nr:RluA family pseudouridine synthase [Candidatus Saccharimonadales bacterium]